MRAVAQQKKVLGHLLGKSSSDDQIRANMGSIFLAEALRDFGWSVEFEPEEAGKTPDLRVRKSDVSSSSRSVASLLHP
jgi:hypothetical protein